MVVGVEDRLVVVALAWVVEKADRCRLPCLRAVELAT